MDNNATCVSDSFIPEGPSGVSCRVTRNIVTSDLVKSPLIMGIKCNRVAHEFLVDVDL